MDEDLPTEYDVIIAGTGMVESIVAAACARIEKKVLHLDSNVFYGHLWATFSLDGLESWMKGCVEVQGFEEDGGGEEGLTWVKSRDEKSIVSDLLFEWFVPKEVEGEGWSQAKIKGMSRKFNLDLAPKLLFSKGPMVELLLQSRVSRYTEFVSIAQILTYLEGKVERVPCSKSDVFSAKHISIIDKRLIMKVLEKCLAYNDNSADNHFEGYENKPFLEYLQYHNIPEHLISYILYSVAMSERNTGCLEAVKRVQKFVHNFGCYGGKSPFLWPLYGSAELLQAFCRLSAVFGGIYYLTRGVDSFGIDSSKGLKKIISKDKELSAAHVVISAASAPPSFINLKNPKKISRAILITDAPIMSCDKETASLLYFPPEEAVTEPVTVIELGAASGACPKHLWIVHLSTSTRDSPVTDFEPVINSLFNTCPPDPNPDPLLTTLRNRLPPSTLENYLNSLAAPRTPDPARPNLLYAVYFSILDTSCPAPSADCPDNVHLCSGPNTHPDFDGSIAQAREIFHSMYPDQEFLPPVPEPSDPPESAPQTPSAPEE